MAATRVGVFGSGALTNEKAYLLGKFARVALQTSNIDYNGRFCMSSGAAASVRAFGLDRGLPFPLDDISRAGAVLLAGSNPGETMPPLMQYFAAQKRQRREARRRRSASVDDSRVGDGPPQAAPGIGRGARQRPAARLHSRRPDRRALHRGAHRGIRRRPRADARLRPGTRRAADRRASRRSRRRRAHSRRGALVDDPHRPRSGTAVAGRRQRARLHQPRAGARDRWAVPAAATAASPGRATGRAGVSTGRKPTSCPAIAASTIPHARRHIAGVWGIPEDDLPGPGKSAYEMLSSMGARRRRAGAVRVRLERRGVRARCPAHPGAAARRSTSWSCRTSFSPRPRRWPTSSCRPRSGRKKTGR